MSQALPDPHLHYVAPAEAPPVRRPPVTSTGWVGWMRENLFSSPFNTLLTLVTAAFLVWLLGGIVSWALRDAEWSVITTNLRLLMVGQYEPRELWRVSLVALSLLALCGATVALAVGISRSIMITLAAVVFALLLIPAAAAQIPPPMVRLLTTPTALPGPWLFTGDAGQNIRIEVEPIALGLVSDADAISGYLENTPGVQNSRTRWNDLKAQIAAGTLTLPDEVPDIQFSLLNASGQTLTSGSASSGSVEVVLPAAGWYALVVEQPATEPTDSYAFLRVDGVRTFTTDEQSVAARNARYGEPPAVTCPTSADCRLYAAERDLRFEGSRNFQQYVSTQLAPFAQGVLLPTLYGVIATAVGAGFGLWARRSPEGRRAAGRSLSAAWVIMLIASWFILRGLDGSTLLPVVPTAVWGGLMLTLVLTVVSIIASFPIGVLLALGRTSNLPILSAVCTIFIEVIRGVPFITVLFFAKLIVPFFISATADIDQVIRMMIGLSIFTAAYLAEVVRGGLQIIAKGQIEAARALGLNGAQQTTLIVLPQALRAVIPAIMNQFVSLFKDTSLVAIVGLFELLGIIDFIVNGQQQFRGLTREAYLFVGIIYFVISYAMSSASRWVERTGVGGAQR